MTELADRLSRHADLHEHQPWADDEQMQFARDLREAVGLIAELARLRAQGPCAWRHDCAGLCTNDVELWIDACPHCGKPRTAPPAQPAEPTIDEQVASVNAAFDAWRNGEDATLTLGLAAQPAEPVQRLSDERAAFEAWHNEYRTQELVRRDDTYYNTHVRCRWEGWQARAIESALQPGWRDIESAPKDELILVGPTKRMGVCVAMHHSRDGWVTETCSEWMTIYTPTRWMPLPPAPKATK